ncbi:pyrokinin-1 receptor [Bemisia tabaci]|uniref:pyrokinin-1 receptor n=1 Tax=Bemisia tabaci TaxID=7038 RepID=UPI003B27BD63
MDALEPRTNGTEVGVGVVGGEVGAGVGSVYPRRDSLYIVVPITIIYGVILITGTVGNVITCCVIARNKSMHNATNFYLFSLAISDLLLLVSGLPQEIYMVWSKYPYIFGEAFCKLRGLAAETSTNASVLTITAFTVERYVAICHPFFARTLSKLSRAVKLILCIWAVSLVFAIPQALQFGIVEQDPTHSTLSAEPGEEMTACQVKMILFEHSFEFSTFVFFFFPMTLISVLYALIGLRLRRSASMRRNAASSANSSEANDLRRRPGSCKQQASQRVLKMLVAVVVAFFICWAPFHAQRLFATYVFTGESSSRYSHLAYAVLTYVSGVFYYISTTINPILYHIMSNKFREAFKGTLSSCCVQRQRPYSQLSLRKEKPGLAPEIGEDATRNTQTSETSYVVVDSHDDWSSVKRAHPPRPPHLLLIRDPHTPPPPAAPRRPRHRLYPCCRSCGQTDCVDPGPGSRMEMVYQKQDPAKRTGDGATRGVYTSNDVSNSSLKDIERGALEDELEAYMAGLALSRLDKPSLRTTV